MIILDVEASGVDYEKNSIVSIGALDLENPANTFYDECRVWAGSDINEGALLVNGFSEAEITDPEKKSEGELVRAFVAWATDIAGDRTLAGQNVSFDRDFVKAACYREGIEFPFAYRTVDTHTLAYMHMIKRGIEIPIANHRTTLNLDAVLNYCGIPEEPQPHNALTGAMSHAEVLSRLLFDKKLLSQFSEYDIPWLTK